MTVNSYFIPISLDDFEKQFFPQEDPSAVEPSFDDVFSRMKNTDGTPSSVCDHLALCINEANFFSDYSVEVVLNDPRPDHIDRGVRAALLHRDYIGKRNEMRYWAYDRLSFVCRPNNSKDDPFEDWENGFDRENLSDRRADTLDELDYHSKRTFHFQHRTAGYTVLILGTHARLLRWERAGCFVSSKFMYRRTHYLNAFLWRFAHMSPEAQGIDPSATLVDPDSDDYCLMEAIACEELPDNEYARQLFYRASLEPGHAWWKLRVSPDPDSANDSAEPRYFLVASPESTPPAMFGRGTRVYVALDCEEQRLVFLKDVWRLEVGGLQKEGDVLKTLNAAHVPHVPTLVCHGHVDGQRTHAQDFTGNNHGILVHYRLVVEEVCRPLDYEGTLKEEDVVQIIADCIEAHQQAVEKANLMHCDISIGNVLIFEEPIIEGEETRHKLRGVLCDWELSRPIRRTDEGEIEAVRVHETMGTRAFQSVRILDHPRAPITIADELEAFFNVLLLTAVEHTGTSIAVPRDFTVMYFDTYSEGGRCGAVKQQAMLEGCIKHGGEKVLFYPYMGVLHILVPILALWFRARYHPLLHAIPDTQNVLSTGGTHAVVDEYWRRPGVLAFCKHRVAALKTHHSMRQLLSIFLDVQNSTPILPVVKDDSQRIPFASITAAVVNIKRPLEVEAEAVSPKKRARF